MEFNWLGYAFVSEDIPNYEHIEQVLDGVADELRSKAQKEFDEILDQMGLEQVMGVIVKKGTVK